MGDVIGDINSRRGRIEGMDDIGGGKIDPWICSACPKCSDMLQIFVPEHRDVVTTQCSSRNMSQVPKSVQEKSIIQQKRLIIVKKLEKSLKSA